MMKKTEQELLEEKSAVEHLLPAETAESRENLKTTTDGQTRFNNGIDAASAYYKADRIC